MIEKPSTYPFDVDLKALQSVTCTCANALFVKLNTLLLEEVLDGWLGNLAVIADAVRLDPSLHVFEVVVRANDLIFGQLADSCDEIFIAPIEHNDTAWEDVIVLDVLVEAWLLAFLQLFFLLFHWLASLRVHLDHFLEEGVLSALVRPREPIRDVAAITAVVLAKFKPEHLPEELVRDANLSVRDLNLRPAFLWLFQFSPLFSDFFLHGLLDLLKLGAAIIDKLVIRGGLLINFRHSEDFFNELSNMYSWNVVVLGKLMRIVGFTAGWWASDEDLDGVEPTMRVEFYLERTYALSDAELGVPWELLLLNQFVLLVLIFQLLLLRSQRHSLESIRGRHAEVDSKSRFPAFCFADLISFNALDLARAHALGDLSNDTLLRGLARLVNGEDVGVYLRVFNHNSSDKSGQVNDMNRRH